MALQLSNGVSRPTLAGVTAFVVATLSLAAYAHGPAEWIQEGGFKNAVGELCCGERDCAEFTEADVKVPPAGYFIVGIKKTVPFDEATPSPTGTYWRCY